MRNLRAFHRYATVVAILFTLFLGVTGTLIQLTDLHSILWKVPATDANVRAMRESFDGPPDFQVRQTTDYVAAALPAGSDYQAMLHTVIASGRKALGVTPFKYLEFRMAGPRAVGQIGVGEGHLGVDATSGVIVQHTLRDIPEDGSPASFRNTVKRLHRMTSFGDWALFINVIVAICLSVLIVTGILIYFKLYAARRKIKRPSPFWRGGGTWREIHRIVSVTSALFLIVVTLSGAWLAIESLGFSINMALHGPPGGFGPGRPPLTPDASSPLRDAELGPMMATTLKAAGRVAPDAAIKVIRLRYYAGYPQGVVVTGGDDSKQLVFNARTGEWMSETEPGYPPVPFPFGWQAHELAKNVHRGDIIGLTGRWMDLLAGLAMVYLSVSGLVMYLDMWKRRRKTGRHSMFWK